MSACDHGNSEFFCHRCCEPPDTAERLRVALTAAEKRIAELTAPPKRISEEELYVLLEPYAKADGEDVLGFLLKRGFMPIADSGRSERAELKKANAEIARLRSQVWTK